MIPIPKGTTWLELPYFNNQTNLYSAAIILDHDGTELWSHANTESEVLELLQYRYLSYLKLNDYTNESLEDWINLT